MVRNGRGVISLPTSFGICCLLVTCAFAESATTRYVDAGATGANNGTSWANAYTNLQSALNVALAGEEIWVAQATYKPAAPGGPRTATFQLRNGVVIYGGFPAGGGTFAQRNPDTFETVLSGDLNGNDAATMDLFHASVQD